MPGFFMLKMYVYPYIKPNSSQTFHNNINDLEEGMVPGGGCHFQSFNLLKFRYKNFATENFMPVDGTVLGTRP